MKIIHNERIIAIWPLHDVDAFAPIINVLLPGDGNKASVVKFANIDEDWRKWSKEDIRRLMMGMQIALDEIDYKESLEAFFHDAIKGNIP